MSSPESEADDPAALAARLIDAINAGDRDAMAELLDADSEVDTGRGEHLGHEAIVAWAKKEFDHLVRRYRVEGMRVGSGSVVATGSVQYLWKEVGEIADSAPVALELSFVDGRLRRMRVHDADPAAAIAAFETRSAG